MCWENDTVQSSHAPKYLYEVTTSSSKPSEVVITLVARRAFFLLNHMAFVQNKVKGRESLLDTEKALLYSI